MGNHEKETTTNGRFLSFSFCPADVLSPLSGAQVICYFVTERKERSLISDMERRERERERRFGEMILAKY